MSKKTKLREQVADGKIKQAIAELRLLTHGDTDLHDEAVSLSGRFQNYQRAKHGNTATPENLDIRLNQIRGAALDLISRLPEDVSRPWLHGWKKVAATIGSVIVFGAAVAELSGYSLRDVFSPNDPPTVEQPAEDTSPTDATKATTLPLDTPIVITPNPATQLPTPNRGTPPAAKTEEPEKPPAPLPDKLTITCKTDRGVENLHYRKGETMRLFFKTNEPCHIRILYRLADGELVLFDDDRKLTAAEVGDFVEIGSGYDAAAPFGEEELFVFAQSGPFPVLQTIPHPIDSDYLLVTDALPEAKRKTRGFKKKYRFAEASLKIKTVP